MEDKKTFRKRLLKETDELSEEYIEASDRGIFENLKSLPEFQSAKTIFVFFSLGREPDTHRITELAFNMGKTVALPISHPRGVMETREIRSLSELVPGNYNIPAPPNTARLIAPEEFDLIIVPAVTYDRDGYRMGRGGGYYDRFLAKSQAFTVGLGREALLCSAVPRESHDMSVHCLITETGVTRY